MLSVWSGGSVLTLQGFFVVCGYWRDVEACALQNWSSAASGVGNNSLDCS